MRQILVFLAILIPSISLAEESKYFAAVDVYDWSDAEDQYNENWDVARTFQSIGSETQESLSSSVGLGLRVGLFTTNNERWEIGPSLGFIVGPKIEGVVDNRDFNQSGVAVGTGRTETTLQPIYGRLIVEAGRKFSLAKFLKVKVDGAVGLAFGATTYKRTVVGSAANTIQAYSETQNNFGPCAEFSPSLLVPIKSHGVEIGARISYFPANGESVRIDSKDWTPISVFLAGHFSF